MVKRFTPADRMAPYERAAQAVLDAIRRGVDPWRPSWSAAVNINVPFVPVNALTGRQYRGVNRIVLSFAAFDDGDDVKICMAGGDPRFCTFNQATGRGWRIKKGAKGFPVFFYKRRESTLAIDDPGEVDEARLAADRGDDSFVIEGEEVFRKRSIPILKTYTVFHASQIDGIPAIEDVIVPALGWASVEAAEQIAAASGVPVIHGSTQAAYVPALDKALMPAKHSFSSAADYYTTLIHELGHATGHPSRLARMFGMPGTTDYAREELRAEMASFMLCGEIGLNGKIEDHASYIDHYLKLLENDPRELFRASKDAQEIADWLYERAFGQRLDLVFDYGVRTDDNERVMIDVADIDGYQLALL
ncbi:DUF1738 domain-containing protein [Niveispirillum sp. SYP-B3756]|uniref:ArdC family protein n=1 Tax=Niveispirillum sp. SYP-B3756 TaxID=2662178 RepID=UPI00129264BF|nr:zincin-like metallopeptidase domain-containing protein [Niveispirillum sp. SYP-B3756]MQP68184.1 DUF1738 domain-containing protein [Niveispirillum sp. SYP-B3756]